MFSCLTSSTLPSLRFVHLLRSPLSQSDKAAASKAFPLADAALTVSILDLVQQANNYKQVRKITQCRERK